MARSHLRTPTFRTRSWLGTLNNYTEKELEQIRAIPCRYIALGFHVGHLSHLPHVHIELDYINKISRPKFNPRIHWEPRKGTLEQALEYLNKDGKLEEIGDKPRTIPNGGGSTQVWSNFIDDIHHGIVDKDSQLYARFTGYVERRASELLPLRTYSGELPYKNLWIYGPTGTGKSRMAHEYSDNVYFKNVNKWWDGYHHQKVVLIEDVDHDCFKIPQTVSNFKKWADRYPFNAEIKGGSITINACEFELIITSQYTIDDCFYKEDADAINRRFEVMSLDDFS